MKATDEDFFWLFSIAKAHGFSLAQCKEIAQVEVGKPLNEFTRKEVTDFGKRICNGPKRDDCCGPYN